MTPQQPLEHCLAKPGAWRDEPRAVAASYQAVVGKLPKKDRPAAR